MKILFVGTIETLQQTGTQRLRAIQHGKYDVTAVSWTHLKRLPRLQEHSGRYLPLSIYEMLLEPRARAGHKLLMESAAACQPDIIWLEWPTMVSKETVIELRKRFPNAVLVSFQDDNPFGDRKFARHGWKRFLEAIPYYDLHFVKRESDLVNYAKLGSKRTEIYVTGYSEEAHFVEPVLPETPRYDVIFIGTAIDHRVGFLDKLTGEQGVEVHIYGSRWDRTALNADRKQLLHGFITDEMYRQVVNAAKISLGFVSHSNHDEYTGRTFELPACGTMLMCERTPVHEGFFVENKEAVFFTTPEECKEKIAYYLAHEDERAKVAAAGMAKAKGYSVRASMEKSIEIAMSCKPTNAAN